MILLKKWANGLSILIFFFDLQSTFAEIPDRNWLEDFNALAEETIQYHKPPGIAIAVVTSNQILTLKTHGVRQLGQEGAIDENTIFRVASVSKPCTSALIAQLATQGRIDIEEPVSRYLPKVQIGGPAHAQQMKIKHLLSHTTGMPGYSLEQGAYFRQDFKALIEKLKSVRPVSNPGEVHQYQNVLYSLLGPVVESVTHTSFADYLRQSLLSPLGITHYALNEADYASCENVAQPHIRVRRRTTALTSLHKLHQSTSYYDNILPAGGMGFSSKDLAKLLQAFMGNYPDILARKALEQCHMPLVVVGSINKRHKKRQCNYKKDTTEHYGLGWRIRRSKGKSIIYHTGELDGYTASIAFSKEDQIGIVILVNASKSVLPNKLSNRFFQILFAQQVLK